MESVIPGRDGRNRRAIIRYRNQNEKVDRRTNRSARSLVIIHHVDEANVFEELTEAQNFINNNQKVE